MRRFFSILLCISMILGLAGCTGTKPTEPTENGAFVIGFSQVGSESDWRIANTKSMTDTFAFDADYEFIMENARQKQENQFASVRRFILDGVDLIIIAPTVEEGWLTVLTEVHDAGIPVIIMDRSVAVWDDNLYLTNIGSDFLRQGNLAVEWLEQETAKETLSEEEEPDGSTPVETTVKILHLQGTIGATAQIQRTKALEDAVAAHSDWVITSQLYGDFTEAKAYEVMTEYLKENQDIDVLYSENDNMTFGAMRALDEAGITYGEGGQVKIITFDATKEALQYCLDGRINLCVECNPMFGPQVKDLIEKYRNGETIPKHVYVDESAYTSKDLTQEFVDAREY
ncbi:ABC transporter substrate-binding protein [Butyrivibrio sp. AE2032]|uniref:ABC transporter substrate-binding protein n=1 Tax=Butyrivibrio sp. AE2032 TaxID=1458463 RepID=UPI00069076A8|nr:ABC transporter substrate-binding protein [Butyrivibrio sp. AE2032]